MLLTSLIAGALLAMQPFAAQPLASGAAATLVEPREVHLTFDGRNWSCDPAGQCVGRGGGTPQPLMRECRRFVARVGAVSAYARDGMALTEAELAWCNAAAAA
jgi:hypothetical protein